MSVATRRCASRKSPATATKATRIGEARARSPLATTMKAATPSEAAAAPTRRTRLSRCERDMFGASHRSCESQTREGSLLLSHRPDDDPEAGAVDRGLSIPLTRAVIRAPVKTVLEVHRVVAGSPARSVQFHQAKRQTLTCVVTCVHVRAH